jgi:hypothetical protein
MSDQEQDKFEEEQEKEDVEAHGFDKPRPATDDDSDDVEAHGFDKPRP